MHLKEGLLLASVIWPASVFAAPVAGRTYHNSTYRKTTVAVLGAGVAGVTAAQALANQFLADFLIIEYNEQIGGRILHTNFGFDSAGNPYTVELGANWISGTSAADGPENPVWTFSKQSNLSGTHSDRRSVATYDKNSAVEYMDIINEYEEDKSQRVGLSENGWKVNRDARRKAVEWWSFDYDAAQPPEGSSLVFGATSLNLTYYQFKNEELFSIDQRGFNAWLKYEAAKFLEPNDPRLMFNTTVKNIEYLDSSVKINNKDGSCVEADYAICTFSLGVLQEDVIEFIPRLPYWKESSISTFSMNTYTKIFLQFNETFWPSDKEYLLYAHAKTRGYYPLFQSLSMDGFFPGSNILMATVVDEQSYRIEAQNDEITKAEIMVVLRQMFPNIDVPEPTAFIYSNWPIGTTLEQHKNLRANVKRLYFAGEHTSAEYFGYLHRAWFEGQEAGKRIAGMLKKDCLNITSGCGECQHYEVLRGTIMRSEYNDFNGMGADPFFIADDGSNSSIIARRRR